ncbi:MAG: hypothetical protein L3K09_07540 [Thermoplasmata archaeon]|nr:hypothetical protein [Thermoplasmata archaeon]
MIAATTIRAINAISQPWVALEEFVQTPYWQLVCAETLPAFGASAAAMATASIAAPNAKPATG